MLTSNEMLEAYRINTEQPQRIIVTVGDAEYEIPFQMYEAFTKVKEIEAENSALKAKLDEIEKWATASVSFDDFGYQMAMESVLQIIRGDELC